MGRFANPKNLLLNLCEALRAALYGKITAGNHDAEGARLHGGEDEFGEIVEGFARFDFENQSQVLAAEFREVLEQIADVGIGADEGVADKIGMLDDELQSLEVING